MNIAYPLQWPVGRARHPARKTGRFAKYGQRITMDYAVRRLRDELSRIAARDAILSTNQELTKAGFPRAVGPITDPAVAVFFRLAGTAHCMPCDTYDRMPDNIAAIAAHIEATRANRASWRRYGGRDVHRVRRAAGAA